MVAFPQWDWRNSLGVATEMPLSETLPMNLLLLGGITAGAGVSSVPAASPCTWRYCKLSSPSNECGKSSYSALLLKKGFSTQCGQGLGVLPTAILKAVWLTLLVVMSVGFLGYKCQSLRKSHCIESYLLKRILSLGFIGLEQTHQLSILLNF